MTSTSRNDEGRPQQDGAGAYPEPPPHPSWHQPGPTYGALSPAQQQHNRELLLRGLRTDHDHTRGTLEEAS
ncbi:hypothetical protein [Streptomyces sp. H39-C1]|uniref:hypothetical protein n=1 Tax=Streptomyces sp. H39-C1 TaxID=3004355 RepID=UPI0022AFBCE3|nr:hypothetical protein [Streptomyces sp. H39-C1]MCZ4098035.1 hypothetical protein [Streptomyces sp. H39-C1]